MRTLQGTFAGGELDPLLAGRVDIQRYHNSVALARNVFAKRFGGLANRPGTRLVAELPSRPWLVPFDYGGAQTYALAFTDRAMRLFSQGGSIVVPPTDAVLVNGGFDGLTGWSDESEGDADVQLGARVVPIDPAGATPLGDMTAQGGVAAAFDGIVPKLWSQCARRSNAATAWVGLDWGSPRTVAGMIVRSSSNDGFRRNENPVIALILQGSADGFATAVELGRAEVRDTGGELVVELVEGVDTSNPYRWHRLVMQGGSGNRAALVAQLTFLEAENSSGRAILTGDGGDAAVLEQAIATTALDEEHVLSLAVEGGDLARLLVRVGATSGGAEHLTDQELRPGRHTVAFRPGTSPFYVQLRNVDDVPVTVLPIELLGSGAAAAVPLVLATPYAEGDLQRLTWTQSRDVMTLAQPAHPPHELVRRGHLSWSLTPLRLTPDVPAPGGLEAVLAAGSGSTTHTYVVTASRDGLESLPSATASVGSAPATLTATNNVALTWSPVPGAESYAVYKDRNGVFGFIGTTETPGFTDDGIAAAVDDTPPRARNPFADGRHPAAVDYYQQRLAFAGGDLTPEVGHLSRTGDFRNFAVSNPLRDDDAITFRPAGRKMGEIRHLLGMQSLLIFTRETVWSLARGDGRLTPALEGGLEPQDGPGAAFVQPLPVGRFALYVRDGGDAAIGLGYDFSADGWVASELSLMAGHLLRPRRIVQWSWAPRPWALIWAVCDDGMLLSCTYDPAQQVTAWTRHETAGAWLSVCAVDEGVEDGVYLATRRRLGGVWRHFVERMATRQAGDVRDAFFVDCGLTYDEPVLVTALGLGTPVSLTVPGHDLAPNDLIDVTGLVGPDALNDRRYRVGTVTGDVITLLADIPSDPPADDFIAGQGLAPWLSGGEVRKALSSFAIPHLAGHEVAVLADGGEQLADGSGDRLVAGPEGQVVLQRPASRVHVGLPYAAEILTLPLAGDGSADFMAAKKVLKTVRLLVDQSRRILAGPSFDRLDEHKPPAPEVWDRAAEPLSKLIKIQVGSSWGEQPRVAIRQTAPLPIEVLAIIPELEGVR